MQENGWGQTLRPGVARAAAAPAHTYAMAAPVHPKDPDSLEGLEKDPVIEEYKKHVDRTLLRENLRRSVKERFENLARMQRLAEQLRKAGKKAT